MEQGYADSETCTAPTKDPRDGKTKRTCCWSNVKEGSKGVFKPRAKYCQTCSWLEDIPGIECDPKQMQVKALEQPPMSQPVGPFAPPQDGVLSEPTTTSDESEFPLTGHKLFSQIGSRNDNCNHQRKKRK
jgi:hypothetical protein